MATYTEHYGLHQWLPEDNFLRTDFNTDHEKIDIALDEILSLAEGKCSLVSGSYTGDAAMVEYTQDVPYRTITLGFQPKALLIMLPEFQFGGNYWNSWNTITLFPGVLVHGTSGNYYTKAQIISTGFQVNNYLNLTGRTYCYLALK